jgi:hypothetical protein
MAGEWDFVLVLVLAVRDAGINEQRQGGVAG